MQARTRSRRKSSPRKKSASTRTTRKRRATKTSRRSSGTRAKRRRSSSARGTRRYSRGASRKVGAVMREMKRGKLRSGRSKKKVTSRKQAIAIGLSEARRRGEKVPRPRGRRASR